MKSMKVMVVLTAAFTLPLVLRASTWTGAVDASWNTAGNWEPSGVPGASDAVEFGKSADISLDTGAKAEIDYLLATSGTTTLSATDGSSLGVNIAGDKFFSGFQVKPGATLVLDAPVAVTPAKNVYRCYEGTLVFRRDFTSAMNKDYAFIVCCGTNILEGSASFTLPNGGLSLGMDEHYGCGITWPFIVRDNARMSVASINFTGGSVVPDVQVVQDGDDTEVAIAGALKINRAQRSNDDHGYVLKRGALTVGGTVSVEASTLDKTGTLGDPLKPHFIVEGGTATVDKVALISASAALRGGRLNLVNGSSTLSVADGTRFEVSGGTLGWPQAFDPSTVAGIDWSGRAAVACAGDLTWNWSGATCADGFVLVYDGTQNLSFTRHVSSSGVGFELAAGRTGLVASGATVTAPGGTYEPWKVTIGDGATLKFKDASSRFSLPLDLAFVGSGKLDFGNSIHLLIAHRLMVNGVEMGKGRYLAKDYPSWISNAKQPDGVVVPYVWTGKGGDTLWSNGQNWDTGTVPPNAATTCVDLSQAGTVTVDSDVSLGCVVAMPNGPAKKTIVSGSGTITLSGGDNSLCAFYVNEGRELELNVDVRRSVDKSYTVLGGGTVTFAKTFPAPKDNTTNPVFMSDATLNLKDISGLLDFNGTDRNNVCFANCDYVSRGRVVYSGESSMSAYYLILSPSGYAMLDEFRQAGGKITADSLWIGNYASSTTHIPSYCLDGGMLKLTNKTGLWLGGDFSGSWTRNPGGSFIMTGGTLEVCGIRTSCNQNYFRATGGEILLNHTSESTAIFTTSFGGTWGATDRNEYGFYLGGVTVKPSITGSATSGCNFYLTGVNGDTTLDLHSGYMYFQKGTTIAGPGGLSIVGGATKSATSDGTVKECNIRSSCLFTGELTVEDARVYLETDNGTPRLDGPRAFRVKSGFLHVRSGFTVAKSPDVIELDSDNSLVLDSGIGLTVKHLIIGGVEKEPGTYTFSSGMVTVEQAPASWISGAVGNPSHLPDGGTADLTASVALDRLTYQSVSGTGAVTIKAEGAAVLTLNEGATIDVAKGSTLVIDADVVIGGKVLKTGSGEVRFNGKVTCPASVTKGAADSDFCWLTVGCGTASFDGAVSGVRLIATSDDGNVPLILLKENCTVSDYAMVQLAYTAARQTVPCRGEIRQQGATVDLQTFPALLTSSDVPLSRLNGGEGKYVLESGTFSLKSNKYLSFVTDYNDHGTFSFVQTGGTLTLPSGFNTVRDTTGQNFSYTLEGGTIELGGRCFGSYDASEGTVSLNGGTVVFSSTAEVLKDADVTLTVGGPVTLATKSASVGVTIGSDLVGAGSVTFAGPGAFALRGYGLGTMDVTGGTVAFGPETASSLPADLALTVENSPTVELGYTGTATIGSCLLDEVAVRPRTYRAGMRSLGECLSGLGALKVANGPIPGAMLIIR